MKLSQLIAQYVTFRKSLGQDFESNERRLRTFYRFAGECLDIRALRPRRVAAFLADGWPITRSWHAKYGALRGLFSYAVTRGYLRASPLPVTVPKQPARFVPHIYSMDELRRLLNGTAFYQKLKSRILIEPHTFRAALLLLYGAGLRVSEALSLNLADVDLEEALIVIRDTKFYKSRLVPLGSDLNDVMAQYAKKRKRDGHPQRDDAPFFVTRLGARIPICLIEHAFRRLRAHSGIYRRGGTRSQPRLHDLRHTAAVHRLTAWYREGKDVQRLLPLLSTYLGHTNIASTQVYLTMTPDLLHEASKRFAKYVFGEVSHD
jgi:site-specific recombinase XerD